MLFLLLNTRAEGCSTQSMTSSCVQPSAGLWTLAADVLTWSLDMPLVSAGAAPEIRLIKEERVDGFDEVMWSELACFHICLAAVETLLEFDCRLFIVNTFRDPRGSEWHWSCSAGTKQQNLWCFVCVSVKWGEDAEGELEAPEPTCRDQQDLDGKVSESLIKSKTSYSCLVLTGLKSTMRLRADLSEQDKFSHVFIME